MDGPQGTVWTVAKKSRPKQGFYHRTVQPVATRYADYKITVHDFSYWMDRNLQTVLSQSTT
jgi:hypothetical protein